MEDYMTVSALGFYRLPTWDMLDGSVTFTGLHL